MGCIIVVIASSEYIIVVLIMFSNLYKSKEQIFFFTFTKI